MPFLPISSTFARISGIGEERVNDRFVAFSFDQLEDRMIAVGKVLNLESLARELTDELLDGE